MRYLLRTTAFLFLILLMTHSVPGVQAWTGRILGALALCVWAGSYRLSFTGIVRAAPAVMGALFCIGLSGALWVRTETAGVALGMAAVYLLSRSRDDRREICCWMVANGLFTLFTLAYTHHGGLWFTLQDLSILCSRTVTKWTTPATLGFSALGGQVFLAGLGTATALVFQPGGNRRRRAILLFVGMVSVHLLWLWQAPLIAAKLKALYAGGSGETAFTIQEMIPLLVLLYGAVFAVVPFCRRVRNREETAAAVPGDSKAPPSPTLSRRRIALFCAGALVTTLLPLLLFASSKGTAKAGRVHLWKDNGRDWRMPRHGKAYGLHSLGRFGVIAEYLRLRGYEVTTGIAEPDAETLARTDILGVLNPQMRLSEPGRRLLKEFVQKGGGLLAIGDHTDVGGVMDPTNDLIAPFGMRLRFDTVLPTRTGWVNSLRLLAHPITREIRREWETALWVGASLECSSPARPIIVGERGWADDGDRSNRKRAFLGDYKRSEGEQLGDLALVAVSEYGSGRVVAFADSSTMQNAIINQTYPFIDALFGWLNRSSPGPGGLLLPGLLVWGAAGCMLLLCFRRYAGLTTAVTVLLVLGVAGSDLRGMIPDAPPADAGTIPPDRYRVAHIDASLYPRLAMYSPSDDSMFGLSMNLLRSGYLPLLTRDFNPERMKEADLFFMIAPAATIDAEKSAALRRYMEGGGFVILSVGWEDVTGSLGFLDGFGLGLRGIPLASRTITRRSEKISFIEAWPIEGTADGDDVWAAYDQYPLMLFRRVGKGGLVLIGDSQFFHSRNLEKYDGKNPDLYNIRYLHKMLGVFRSLRTSASKSSWIVKAHPNLKKHETPEEEASDE